MVEPGPNYAMFVDYDNVAVALDQRAKETGSRVVVGEAVVLILDRLKDFLESAGRGFMNFRLGRAYGDWTGFTDAPSSLAVRSIQPVYVLTKPGKSSADLELSLDAQEILLTRDDVEHFVLVGGDRDYIPVVRRIQERGRGVTVAALGQTMSGDLKAIVGGGFVDLEEFVAPLFAPPEAPPATPPEPAKVAARRRKVAPPIPIRSEVATSEENLSRTLDLIVEATLSKGTNEIPLVSFFKDFMNEAFVTLIDGQRKEIIEALRQKDALDLEIRQGPSGAASGLGFEFVMMVVNKDHPLVSESVKRRASKG